LVVRLKDLVFSALALSVGCKERNSSPSKTFAIWFHRWTVWLTAQQMSLLSSLYGVVIK